MAAVIPMSDLIARVNLVVANELEGAVLRLFDNNETPDEASVLSDFNEASFTGYSPVALTGWSAGYDDGAGKAKSDAPSAGFTPTGAGGSGSLYGWFLTNSGNTVLYAASRFGSPPISVAQFVTLIIVISDTGDNA